MFSKRIGLTLVILFVLCYSSTLVGASQDNITTTIDENIEILNQVPVTEKINVESDPILKTSHSLNGGSFEDIQNIIDDAESGDTIILNGKFVAKDETSTISINKKLNITSTSGAILDGDNLTRIFSLKNESQYSSISNLIFVNGKYTIGSAVYVTSKHVLVDNCTFKNNHGTYNGGGAFATPLDTQASEDLTIKNCIFTGNWAPTNSGALACFSINFKIINTLFENNYATNNEGRKGYAGALEAGMKGSYGLIYNCTFRNNFAKSDNTTEPSYGGAALLREGSVFENCIFINNTAHKGGAITVISNGTIKNSTFIENSAENGGAIYADQPFTITKSIFKSNHALTNGGGIYNSGNLLVENSIFTDNYASNGGAIYNLGTLNSKNCQYQKNKAKSTLKVNSESTVKCSDNADIKVTLEGGNNIINAIWSKNQVTIDDKSINPNNRISSQSIIVNINGKIFTSKTNANGEADFKINTKNFKVKSYKCTASLKDSNDYFESSQQFDLKIITKIAYKTKIKNIKKIKKVKKYQAYIPTTKYVKVKYKIEYYKVKGNIVFTNIKLKEENGVKKIKKLDYKWKKVSKKSIKTKYKWYKSKYCHVTTYKATKIKYKYVNGKLAKKSVNKNYKYTKNSKYKNKRTKDWSKYVLPSTDCESDNKKIIKLSKKIIKKEAKRLKKPVSKLTDKQKANAILKWVQGHIKYDLYGNTRYGALKSLILKKGNCVDSSHITVALLRAANIPAKYEAKTIGEKAHCWPCAYLGGKWLAGEPTYDKYFPNFGKSKWTNENWVQKKAKPGTYINLHKYSKKIVQYGKNKKWGAINEIHLIEGKWRTYYVLEGNADTTYQKTNVKKLILNG